MPLRTPPYQSMKRVTARETLKKINGPDAKGGDGSLTSALCTTQARHIRPLDRGDGSVVEPHGYPRGVLRVLCVDVRASRGVAPGVRLGVASACSRSGGAGACFRTGLTVLLNNPLHAVCRRPVWRERPSRRAARRTTRKPRPNRWGSCAPVGRVRLSEGCCSPAHAGGGQPLCSKGRGGDVEVQAAVGIEQGVGAGKPVALGLPVRLSLGDVEKSPLISILWTSWFSTVATPTRRLRHKGVKTRCPWGSHSSSTNSPSDTAHQFPFIMGPPSSLHSIGFR